MPKTQPCAKALRSLRKKARILRAASGELCDKLDAQSGPFIQRVARTETKIRTAAARAGVAINEIKTILKSK